MPVDQICSAYPVHVFLDRVCSIYPRQSKYLLAALEDVQGYYVFIPKSAVPVLSGWFHVSGASVQQWMDMPGLFRVHPPARHLLKICCGPICSGSGGGELLAGLQASSDGVDGEVSVLASPCLGRCNEVPVAKLNNRYFTRADDVTLRKCLLDLKGADNVS